MNAVSGVSVRPTHRRRGTLGCMIADDVARATARGEVASILIASEWPIYGRFGYGPATWKANWMLRSRSLSFLVEVGRLGAASLGGTRLVDVTRVGGATEHRAGALREADLLFRAADPPWCTTWF